MNEEKKENLKAAKRKVEIANKCRLVFLFAAVIGLVFIYFGNKVWDGIAWYNHTVAYLYTILFVDIFLMFLSTIVKFFFVVRYNKMVKKL